VILTQHYLACLSHASYLIGDESSGRAVVVDPRRDVDVYVAEAADRGLRIERIIETHVHADFLSGHLELAARTNAVVCYGAGADVEFPIERLHDGQRIELGAVGLEVLATPGHTPESICLLVWEHRDDDVPYGVLTGDTLFVGDVGRPDLLASAGAGLSPEALARQLHRSLRRKLLPLPDGTRVFPAHGAGSSCGRQLSTETSSTIGEQRRTNHALAPMTEDQFVAVITEGQPPRPPYFEYTAERNRRRRPLLDDLEPARLRLGDVLRRQAAGAVLLDGREPADFAPCHLRGALNVGMAGRFAEWAGDVLAPHRDIVLVGDPALAREARLRLARIGLDRVVGQLDDLSGAIGRDSTLVESSSRYTVGELAELLGPHRQLLDVRSPIETAAGTLPGARELPLAALVDAIAHLDRSRPVTVYCASGYRSQIAASVLMAAGFGDVSDLLGGANAWEHAGLPLAERTPQAAGRDHVATVDDPDLVIHSVDPLNCETSIGAIDRGAVTPNDCFYVRNHFRTPVLDATVWRLHVGGLVDHTLRLDLDDLIQMPSETLVATLECAGNGRTGFDPPVAGEQWHLGAVSTAEWTGVPLAAVLDRAGVRPDAVEVLFRGADGGLVDGARDVRFERSLPLGEARRSGAVLAFAMNGDALPVQHGAPVRVIVPSWYAVTSVKWLTDIELIGTPFVGYFQAERYVYDCDDPHRATRPVTLQDVRALVTHPVAEAEVARGAVVVRGVAWSGAAPIAAVDVRIGDGRWQPARLLGEPCRHRWQRWELLARIDLAGPSSVAARATDVAGRVQPERAPWNRLGYGNNAVHVVPIRVE
jgi:DMSO/TMAO reductase YedYZ molybdopterin-dependent catalytic subunit/glyoxylase-like metal-dependent hydrolase (beta-lactamase superfamily II)/rhodanese-related sulfurtransferase